MNRSLSGALVAALLCPILFMGCPPGFQPVFFTDRALESAVRAEVGAPLGFLTEADCLRARSLDAQGLNIASLNGLENCRNLTWVNLSENAITNLEPLTQLTQVNFLDLTGNQVTNVSALAGLLSLELLVLSGDGNEVRDITPLVANAQNNPTSQSMTIVLSAIHFLDNTGEVLGVFEDDVNALLNEGVTVLFTSGTDGT